MRAFRNFFLLFCLTTLLFALPSSGADWRSLDQPIGTLVVVETAATVNARLGGNPPFETTTDVTTITTGVPQYFVRFYNPTDPVNPSGPLGSWIMRAAAVRGLTPTEVRDLFALPSMPTNMTMILVPPGYNVYTGIAGPIAGWGAGGGLQSKLIGPPWVPEGNFFNRQAVMDYVLSYRLLAPDGNAGRIAAYLDGRIPAAYTDLELVYLNLDMLYTRDNSSRFRNALDQIGPGRYDLLAKNGLYAAVLFIDAVDSRISSLFSGKPSGLPVFNQFAGHALPMETEKQDNLEKRVWVRALGGSQRAGDLGFNSSSGGVFGGSERQVSRDAIAGFSIGFLHSSLDWTTEPGGGAGTDYANIGIYTAWMPDDLFLQGGIGGGFARSDVSRRIAFSNIDRTAFSEPKGWDANGRVRIGYRLPIAALDVVPTAGMDFYYQYRESFIETGADSLNLRVSAIRSRTLRHQLGVDFSKDLAIGSGMRIAPRLQIGWGREHYLDDRGVTSGLDNQSGEFTVYGDSETADIYRTGAGVSLLAGKRFSLSTQYTLEYRDDRKDHMLYAGLDYRF